MTSNQPTRVGTLMPPDPTQRAAALSRVLGSNVPLTQQQADLVLDRDAPSMLQSDAAAVLAAAAAVDSRVVTAIQAQEWAYALAGLTREECLTAVRRYRQEHRTDDRGRPEWMTPGCVRAEVMQLRAEHAQAERIEHYRGIVAAYERGELPGQPNGPELPERTTDPETRYEIARDLVARHDAQRREQAQRVRDGQSRRLPPPPGQSGGW